MKWQRLFNPWAGSFSDWERVMIGWSISDVAELFACSERRIRMLRNNGTSPVRLTRAERIVMAEALNRWKAEINKQMESI